MATCPTISGYTVVYTDWSTGNEYKSGKTLPSIGDMDSLEVYNKNISVVYYYNSEYGGWEYYLRSWTKDAAQPTICNSINNKLVISMDNFMSFESTEEEWFKIEDFTQTIPAGVKNLNYALAEASNLSGLIRINATPTNYDNFLPTKGTEATKDTAIKLTGSGGNLAELAATSDVASVYIAPTITFKTQRCTVDGSLSDLGEYCKVTTTITGDPIATEYTAAYDIGGNAYTQTYTVDDTSEHSFEFMATQTFDTETTYECTVSVADNWGTTRTASDPLTTAFFTIDIADGGREIAFGGSANSDKVPDNGYFHCYMDAKFENEEVEELQANKINDVIYHAPINHQNYSVTKSLSSGTSWTDTGCKLTLEPGYWIVIQACYFPNPSNGSAVSGRASRLINNTTADAGYIAQNQITCRNDYTACTNGVQSIVVPEDTNYEVEVQAYQNSGKSIAASPRLYAIRIG